MQDTVEFVFATFTLLFQFEIRIGVNQDQPPLEES